ncbi:MAG TPA: hypothetical protein VLW05_08930 [Gaiellaceae bacterium]|nr:hypothetical protein [Gaiellaceae bacterium]
MVGRGGAARPPRRRLSVPRDGTKIDPVNTGTYALPFGSVAGSISITVYDTPAGQEFDFQTDDANNLVTSLVAKGGPAFESWTPDASSGTGLHASLNPHSGYWYDLSYLCFTTSGVQPA